MWRFIQIGDSSFIPAYNLFVGLGIALAMTYLQFDKAFVELSFQRKNLIHTGIFIAIVFGFLGAFFFDAFTQGVPLSFNNLNQVGLTFLGGILAAVSVFIVFLKLNSIPVLSTLHLLTPSLCLAHIIGRVACFFAGCCFGLPTDSFLGVEFPADSLPHQHFQMIVPVHPTQLYESGFVLLIFLWVRKSSVRNKFFFYLLFYAVFRFFLEYLRADDRGSIFNQTVFSPSQLVCIVLAMLSIGFICLVPKRYSAGL